MYSGFLELFFLLKTAAAAAAAGKQVLSSTFVSPTCIFKQYNVSENLKIFKSLKADVMMHFVLFHTNVFELSNYSIFFSKFNTYLRLVSISYFILMACR